MGIARLPSARLVAAGALGGAFALVLGCQNGQNGASADTASDNNALTAADPRASSCLHQASNADLIAELQSRLNGSGTSGSSGGTTGASAAASFTCDNSAYINISVVAGDGTEKTARVFVGNADACSAAASLLNRNRHSITTTSLVGICDNSAYINRFSITPDGALQTLSRTFVGNADACTQQANGMDGG